MMIADVEVGCFLSGGVDSSLVAYLMQKNSEKKISTFSVDLMKNMTNQVMQDKLQTQLEAIITN